MKNSSDGVICFSASHPVQKTDFCDEGRKISVDCRYSNKENKNEKKEANFLSDHEIKATRRENVFLP